MEKPRDSSGTQKTKRSTKADAEEGSPVRKRFRAKPKRPLTGYNRFFRQERVRWIEEESEKKEKGIATGYEDDNSFLAMGKAISARWIRLPEEEKEKFKAEYRAELHEYRQDMEAYKQEEDSEAKKVMATLGADEEKIQATKTTKSASSTRSRVPSTRKAASTVPSPPLPQVAVPRHDSQIDRGVVGYEPSNIEAQYSQLLNTAQGLDPRWNTSLAAAQLSANGNSAEWQGEVDHLLMYRELLGLGRGGPASSSQWPGVVGPSMLRQWDNPNELSRGMNFDYLSSSLLNRSNLGRPTMLSPQHGEQQQPPDFLGRRGLPDTRGASSFYPLIYATARPSQQQHHQPIDRVPSSLTTNNTFLTDHRVMEAWQLERLALLNELNRSQGFPETSSGGLASASLLGGNSHFRTDDDFILLRRQLLEAQSRNEQHEDPDIWARLRQRFQNPE